MTKLKTKRRCKLGQECGMSCINNNITCWKKPPEALQNGIDTIVNKIKEREKTNDISTSITSQFNSDRKLGDKIENIEDAGIDAKLRLSQDLQALPDETRQLVADFIKRNNIKVEMPPNDKEKKQYKEVEIRQLLEGIKQRNQDILGNEKDIVRFSNTANTIIPNAVQGKDLNNVEKFAKFFGFNKNQFKKLNLDKTDVAALYAYVGGGTSNGFTFNSTNHVVIKRDINDSSKSPVDKKLMKDVEDKLDQKINKRNWWSMTEVSKKEGNSRLQKMSTFIHELGHQVDNKSMANSIGMYDIDKHSVIKSGYSIKNKGENFAENFALWVQYPQYYKKKNPEGAKRFEEFIKA